MKMKKLNDDKPQHKTLAIVLIVNIQDKEFYWPFGQFSEFKKKFPIFVFSNSDSLEAENAAARLFGAENFDYRNVRTSNQQLALKALSEVFALGFERVFFIDCKTLLDNFSFHLLLPTCLYLETRHPQVGAVQFWNFNLGFNASPSNELCYTGDDLYGVCVFKKCWDAVSAECQRYCDLIDDFGPEASEIKTMLAEIPHGKLPLTEPYEKHVFSGTSSGWNVLFHRLMVSKDFMRVCFSRNRAKRISYERSESKEPAKVEINPSYGSLADKFIESFILNENRNQLLKRK